MLWVCTFLARHAGSFPLLAKKVFVSGYSPHLIHYFVESSAICCRATIGTAEQLLEKTTNRMEHMRNSIATGRKREYLKIECHCKRRISTFLRVWMGGRVQ